MSLAKVCLILHAMRQVNDQLHGEYSSRYEEKALGAHLQKERSPSIGAHSRFSLRLFCKLDSCRPQDCTIGTISVP